MDKGYNNIPSGWQGYNSYRIQTTQNDQSIANGKHDGNSYNPLEFNKVLIVGLGQLGLPVANYVKLEEGIGNCLPKDTKMFLQSSKSIKSKILTAAIEADQDYRRLRAELEKGINLPDNVRNNQMI